MLGEKLGDQKGKITNMRIYGEGQGITMTSNGEGAIWKVTAQAG